MAYDTSTVCLTVLIDCCRLAVSAMGNSLTFKQILNYQAVEAGLFSGGLIALLLAISVLIIWGCYKICKSDEEKDTQPSKRDEKKVTQSLLNGSCCCCNCKTQESSDDPLTVSYCCCECKYPRSLCCISCLCLEKKTEATQFTTQQSSDSTESTQTATHIPLKLQKSCREKNLNLLNS